MWRKERQLAPLGKSERNILIRFLILNSRPVINFREHEIGKRGEISTCGRANGVNPLSTARAFSVADGP